MVLFKQHMMSGLSGQIMQSKSKKDSAPPPKEVSAVADTGSGDGVGHGYMMLHCCSTFISSRRSRQTAANENAWFKSFVSWLILLHTCFVISVVMSALVMKDVFVI